MAAETQNEQRIFSPTVLTLQHWIDGFLTAKRAERKAPKTVIFYQVKIGNFVDYCRSHNVETIEAIDPGIIREWLLHLEQTGHNPGGISAYYRTLKVFLRWYEIETEPDGWRNPIRKIKPPKVPEEFLDPASIEAIAKLIQTCKPTRTGLRDKAMIMTLFDTGVRASELLDFEMTDLDPITGVMIVRKGKGSKRRTVFAGEKTRRALRAYLKVRGPLPGSLFSTSTGQKMKYHSLRTMIMRRSVKAQISPPPLHSFRRAFTINCLRAGMDLLTLQRLLGHSDLSMLKRYAKQTSDDLQAAHAASSPVDRAGL